MSPYWYATCKPDTRKQIHPKSIAVVEPIAFGCPFLFWVGGPKDVELPRYPIPPAAWNFEVFPVFQMARCFLEATLQDELRVQRSKAAFAANKMQNLGINKPMRQSEGLVSHPFLRSPRSLKRIWLLYLVRGIWFDSWDLYWSWGHWAISQPFPSHFARRSLCDSKFWCALHCCEVLCSAWSKFWSCSVETHYPSHAPAWGCQVPEWVLAPNLAKGWSVFGFLLTLVICGGFLSFSPKYLTNRKLLLISATCKSGGHAFPSCFLDLLEVLMAWVLRSSNSSRKWSFGNLLSSSPSSNKALRRRPWLG